MGEPSVEEKTQPQGEPGRPGELAQLPAKKMEAPDWEDAGAEEWERARIGISVPLSVTLRTWNIGY